MSTPLGSCHRSQPRFDALVVNIANSYRLQDISKGCGAVLSWECTDVWLAWFSWFSHRGGTGKGCHEQRNIERQQCRTLITVELFCWFLALAAQWFGSSPWLHPFARKSSAYNVMGVQVAERKDEHIHERQWSLVSCLLRFYVHIF